MAFHLFYHIYLLQVRLVGVAEEAQGAGVQGGAAADLDEEDDEENKTIDLTTMELFISHYTHWNYAVFTVKYKNSCSRLAGWQWS